MQTLTAHLGQKGGAERCKPGLPKMLVLADIERLSPDAQACLDSHLGGIGAPDAAVVATTALAPEHLARVAGFRRDLWLRFSVHPVCLAPLSSRRADIPLLADAMASAIAERWRIRRPALADRATDELVAAALSGNLTEPETALASAIPAAPPSQPITAELVLQAQQGLAEGAHAAMPAGSFDDWLAQPLSTGTFSVTKIESHIFRAAVDRASGNLSAAAQSLGLSRAQLANRVNGAARGSHAAVPEPEG